MCRLCEAWHAPSVFRQSSDGARYLEGCGAHCKLFIAAGTSVSMGIFSILSLYIQRCHANQKPQDRITPQLAVAGAVREPPDHGFPKLLQT